MTASWSPPAPVGSLSASTTVIGARHASLRTPRPSGKQHVRPLTRFGRASFFGIRLLGNLRAYEGSERGKARHRRKCSRFGLRMLDARWMREKVSVFGICSGSLSAHSRYRWAPRSVVVPGWQRPTPIDHYGFIASRVIVSGQRLDLPFDRLWRRLHAVMVRLKTRSLRLIPPHTERGTASSYPFAGSPVKQRGRVRACVSQDQVHRLANCTSRYRSVNRGGHRRWRRGRRWK